MQRNLPLLNIVSELPNGVFIMSGLYNTHQFASGSYKAKVPTVVEEVQREVHGVQVGETQFYQTLPQGAVVEFFRMSKDNRSVWFKQEANKDDITYYRIDLATAQGSLEPVE